MTDVHNKVARSKNMSAIKGKNTQPELLIRKILHARGFRFRLHQKDLPGNPDIVLSRYKVLIFVHGCFWHGHHCHLSKIPQTRMEFWLGKISGTITRDQLLQTQLLKSDWRYALIWECALRGKTRVKTEDLFNQLENWIVNGKEKYIEISGVTYA